jgi:predicted nucleotidyltransferase
MKDLASIKQVLTDIKPELQRRFHVRAIGVFGSYARGDQQPDSDIDIIVDFSQQVGIEFIDLADFIEGKLANRVDLVSPEGHQTTIFKVYRSGNRLCLNEARHSWLMIYFKVAKS